jgi:cysteine desulfurase
MLPWLTGERFGNPSGGHAVARAARQAVEEARDAVADVLGCRPGEVVFTGGGTEADNLALHGATRPVGSAVEHHAVLHGLAGTVPVHADGRVDVDALAAVEADLVSVMLVNNEVGSVNDLGAVRAAAGDDVVLHTDAVQAVPWLDVAAAAAPADLVSVSAHKAGGPQGVGVLVVREGTPVSAMLHGGGQERERRSGTHNVAGIAGMAAALTACAAGRGAEVARIGALRDRLADGLVAAVPGCTESGDRATKVAGICSLLVEGIESEALLVLLDRAGLCATAASSCASGALEPSHVLAAMGLPRALAAGSLRLSLGWTTTDADVDAALAIVPACVDQLRRTAA